MNSTSSNYYDAIVNNRTIALISRKSADSDEYPIQSRGPRLELYMRLDTPDSESYSYTVEIQIVIVNQLIDEIKWIYISPLFHRYAGCYNICSSIYILYIYI